MENPNDDEGLRDKGQLPITFDEYGLQSDWPLSLGDCKTRKHKVAAQRQLGAQRQLRATAGHQGIKGLLNGVRHSDFSLENRRGKGTPLSKLPLGPGPVRI